MPGIDPLFEGTQGALLDPLDPCPIRRRALRDWLQLQAALCLRPMDALAALQRSRAPAEALALAKMPAPQSESALERSIALLARHRVCALPITSPAYPARLRVLPDPAPLLLVAGDASLLGRRAVGLVGARAASAYGLGVAGRLAGELAAAGLVVVSGLARGVDAAAHRGALDAGGLTVAVQACGPERVYPPEHASLRARICQRGAVLGEFPPGFRPRAAFFPLRNRLISGLVEVVVVVEARERSGSLITARHALNQGREVMVVPGPLSAPTSRGSNRLLRDGARPLLEAGDVLEAMGIARLESRPPSAEQRPAPPLGAEERAILAQLRHEPLSRDELARRLEFGPQRLAAPLLALELAGRLIEERDGRLHPTVRERGRAAAKSDWLS